MIKIKTKRIKEDKFNEYVGISYKTKDTSNYEHLVLINHLLKELMKTKAYKKEDLMQIIKVYLDKE